MGNPPLLLHRRFDWRFSCPGRGRPDQTVETTRQPYQSLPLDRLHRLDNQRRIAHLRSREAIAFSEHAPRISPDVADERGCLDFVGHRGHRYGGDVIQAPGGATWKVWRVTRV